MKCGVANGCNVLGRGCYFRCQVSGGRGWGIEKLFVLLRFKKK